jgi:hypothetical protein
MTLQQKIGEKINKGFPCCARKAVLLYIVKEESNFPWLRPVRTAPQTATWRDEAVPYGRIYKGTQLEVVDR